MESGAEDGATEIDPCEAERAVTKAEAAADRRAAVQRLVGLAAIGPLAAILFDPTAAHAC